tara:strand:- start:1053 stop:1715 length:663 start_codon:yes stop_codon:yes gene_type:complete
MAAPFKAFGKGNGFNRCLNDISVNQVLNAPSLSQTMNAYWNFDSATFGSATFDPDNEPKDLICDEDANRGSEIAYGSNNLSTFSVGNTIPAKCNGDIYIHGINFQYVAFDNIGFQRDQSIIIVDYRSTVASAAINTYDCETLRAGTTYGDTYTIGKVTTAYKTFASTAVNISGIPFVKTVSHEFYGERYDDPVGSGNAPCITPFYLPEPTELPSISFHTY